ncbi:Transcription elongation factor, mitochondrial [Varanus komodoensis]|nr:Transcription elongation factor, mitochondrial [Varanus komodoensis]
MSWERLPALLRIGRRCFLQVPFTSSQLPQCHRKSTSIMQEDSALAVEHLKETAHTIDDLFSSEQRSAVLQLLNSGSREELSTVKLLRGRKSANIVEYRNKHGPFRDLHTLLEVPLFQHKTAVNVCNFILTKDETKERKTNIPVWAMRCITPPIKAERLEVLDEVIKGFGVRRYQYANDAQLYLFLSFESYPAAKNANSIVSVVFGTHKIAWTHITRNMVVHDWRQQACTKFMKKTCMPSVYFEQISSIVSNLPEADFYVLEKCGLPCQNPSLFPVVLHFCKVETMFYALLNKTFAQDRQHKVVSMARSAVGKYFGLMIGETRTSGIELVKQLLSETVIQDKPRVSFVNGQAINYRHMLSANKHRREEELCDSLLQAVAFTELLIQNTAA